LITIKKLNKPGGGREGDVQKGLQLSWGGGGGFFPGEPKFRREKGQFQRGKKRKNNTPEATGWEGKFWDKKRTLEKNEGRAGFQKATVSPYRKFKDEGERKAFLTRWALRKK